MKTKAVIYMAMVVVLLSDAVAFAADAPATIDKIKAAVKPGEMVLTGTEVKEIYEGKRAQQFHVCVKAQKEAAPIKLMHDGQETVVDPGDCRDVTARKIDAAPARELTGSEHIVATFHRVRTQKQQ